MDEMRDRLIAVLKTAKDEIIDLDLKGLADKLMAAGAILPKFTNGQEVWYIFKSITESKIIKHDRIHEIIINECYGVHYDMDNSRVPFHENLVFATEAEARAVLEGKE